MSTSIVTLTPEDSGGLSLSEDFWRISHPRLDRIHVQGSTRALGLLSQLPQRGLAIVGTREPTLRSLEEVERHVMAMAGQDLVIVSGLARGIDAAAHSAALRAGLPTIALVGASLECPYPTANQELRERILTSDGLVVSEFPEGTLPHAGNFLKRNRLIAGWSRVVWVVEAGFRSGALNTARHARDTDRPVFATPCFPGDPALTGNQELIDRHHALPFWGPHSLGAYFDQLLRIEPASHRTASRKLSDPQRLARQVRAIELSRNRAQVPELLDWSTSNGWSPDRFFTALQQALASGLVLDENGLLLKNPHHYS